MKFQKLKLKAFKNNNLYYCYKLILIYNNQNLKLITNIYNYSIYYNIKIMLYKYKFNNY